jgi:pantoate--beta-alanine ligase
MQLVESVRELQEFSEKERRAGRRVALVPTMGALHEGHLALVHEARRRADRVVVSIFVNPAQFGPGEDYAAYPRPLEDDLASCRAAGVDVVFAPEVAELYPDGAQTFVEVERASQPLCGATRPGHFRGVSTVVTKLLVAARPHAAVFGLKDFQQVAVIRRLVRDLCFDVEIVGVPTVREADGLALSSRNVFLDARTRPQARALGRALRAAESAVAGGETRSARLLERVTAELGAEAPLGSIDYAELRDPDSLELAPERLAGPALLALAVRFPLGSGDRRVRLIDNTVLRPRSAVAETPPEESP